MNHVLNSDRPDKVALIEGDNTFTYAQIESRIGQFASGLLAGRSDLAGGARCLSHAGRRRLRDGTCMVYGVQAVLRSPSMWLRQNRSGSTA